MYDLRKLRIIVISNYVLYVEKLLAKNRLKNSMEVVWDSIIDKVEAF